MKILVAEDDPQAAEFLRRGLAQEGTASRRCRTGAMP